MFFFSNMHVLFITASLLVHTMRGELHHFHSFDQPHDSLKHHSTCPPHPASCCFLYSSVKVFHDHQNIFSDTVDHTLKICVELILFLLTRLVSRGINTHNCTTHRFPSSSLYNVLSQFYPCINISWADCLSLYIAPPLDFQFSAIAGSNTIYGNSFIPTI